MRRQHHRPLGRARWSHGLSVKARSRLRQHPGARRSDHELVYRGGTLTATVRSGGPMAEIVNPEIENYLRRLYDDGDPVRLEMEELAQKKSFPIVGPLVGRMLVVLTRAMGAKRVFELGSG